MGACNKRTDETPVTKDDIQPPVTGPPTATASLTDVPIEPVVVVVAKAPEVQPLPVRASLQLPGEVGTDTHNTSLPPVFYVIVGRGPAATIDHTTLLQADFGRTRMKDSPAGEIPVLHIGFSNPWLGFFEHGMGQPSYLLNLPGFHPDNQPGSPGMDAMKDAGLKSTTFGACVDREMARCLREERYRWRDKPTAVQAQLDRAGWPILNGWVVWVQTAAKEPLTHVLIEAEIGGAHVKAEVIKKLNEDYPVYPPRIAPYRLLVLRTQGDHLEPQFVYAQFIDFCTGSGRPRQDKGDAAYKTARLEPWRDPATWPGQPAAIRKIAVAAEAVRSEFTWASGKRACIANGGAIALNAAERARDKVCWTDWFHNTNLLEAFGNPRNFTYIKSKNAARARTPDEDKPITEPDLIAADKQTRLGRFAQVKSVTEAADCDIKLEVGIPRGMTVAPPTQPATIIREYANVTFPLASEMWNCSDRYREDFRTATGKVLPSSKYDYLVLHQGLVTDQLGQPPRSGITVTATAAPDAGGTAPMVCLASGDQTIRVLGAAAQSAVPGAATATGLAKTMWDYRATLPVSAVPDGFILSGINIANANEFFKVTPNLNVNTMTAEQLKDALAERGQFTDADDLANKIVAARNLSNGYSSAKDLMAKVTAYAPFQSAPATTAEAETTKLRLKHESEVKALSEGPKSDDVTNLIEAKRENFRLETGLWTEHPDVMLARLKRDDDNRLAGLASRLNFAVKFAYE